MKNMDQDGHLTKRERKELGKQEKREQNIIEKRKKNFIKWGAIIIVVAIVGIASWWVVKESSKPLPGQAVEDLGREHIPKEKWDKFKYNSNPPTSGPHDADWIKAGVYNAPQGDGYLVHSLEHGYIIISYNCEKKFSIYHFPFIIEKAHAHEGEEEDATVGTESPELGDAWQSKECKDLAHQLKDLAEEQRMWKLILVPRPNLDARIALTAWTRLDTLDKFDKERIGNFINVFRDRGPEKTME